MIRIGNFLHVAAFIGGISGATSSGGVGVFVDGAGQLGTLTSSARFKERIASLGETFHSRVQALRPVSFVYRPEFDDGSQQAQYGLIAEEVAEVFPELVLRNADGSVRPRYNCLVAAAGEVQRLERERASADAERTRLEDRVRRLEETLTTLAAQRRCLLVECPCPNWHETCARRMPLRSDSPNASGVRPLGNGWQRIYCAPCAFTPASPWPR